MFLGLYDLLLFIKIGKLIRIEQAIPMLVLFPLAVFKEYSLYSLNKYIILLDTWDIAYILKKMKTDS